MLYYQTREMYIWRRTKMPEKGLKSESAKCNWECHLGESQSKRSTERAACVMNDTFNQKRVHFPMNERLIKMSTARKRINYDSAAKYHSNWFILLCFIITHEELKVIINGASWTKEVHIRSRVIPYSTRKVEFYSDLLTLLLLFEPTKHET